MELLVLFAPLLGAIVSGFFYKFIGEKVCLFFTTILVVLAACLSWLLFLFHDSDVTHKIQLFRWINSGELSSFWALRIDSLTLTMLIVVTSVSALVHIYSFGYMAHDINWKSGERYKARFFSYLSFFTFTMLVLVTSDNLAQMFFGWEGVGLASYLLIGFYYKKPSANAAAIKAFVVNRVGDFGFVLGIFCLFKLTGSIEFDDIFLSASDLSQNTIDFLGFNFNALELIAFLIFIGAMGKSAQLFLHTWLPDAMEGPTPVSALIHAATMVTAGVFLVCRMSPVIEYAPAAATFITVIGALTAFFAASIALVQNDIKRVIAYSTCSQLGFMFVAAGVGFYHAAMFHLLTHAFFKALLFLGAGSVIHAMHHEQDMRNYGGLWSKIPYTFAAMLIGTLAITGFGMPFSYDLLKFPFGFAGFASKDSIFEGVFVSSSKVGMFSFWMLLFAAFMTSFYSWRLIFLTFFGLSRGDKSVHLDAKESPNVMLIPLFILSLGAIVAGVLFYNKFVGYGASDFFSSSIFVSSENHILHDFHYVPAWVKLSPFVAMVIGLSLAYIFYIYNPKVPARLVSQHRGLYQLLLNKWYVDELYDFVFVRFARFLGKLFWKFGDEKIIDGVINKVSLVYIPKLTRLAGRMQSGYLFHYAFGIILGLVGIVTWFSLFKGVG